MGEKSKRSGTGEGSLVRKFHRLKKKLSPASDHDSKRVGTPSSQPQDQTSPPIQNGNFASDVATGTGKSDKAGSKPLRLSLLWRSAYRKLKETEPDIIRQYEKEAAKAAGIEVMSSDDDEFLSQMNKIVEIKQQQIENNRWKKQFMGHELAIKDFVEPVASLLQWTKGVVGDALEVASYPPASLAWAGVSLVLTLVLNPYDQEAIRTTALLRIAELIKQCTLREESYKINTDILTRLEAPDTGISDGMYRSAIEDLYLEILKFQARVVHFFAGHRSKRGFQEMVKWNDWKGWFDEITSKETNLKEIEERYSQVNADKRWRYNWDRMKTQHDDMMRKLDLTTKAITQISIDRDDARRDQERNKFIEWLNPLDCHMSDQGKNKKRVMARPQPNAYSSEFSKWLIKRLGSWQDMQNSFVWLCGQAGYGKSKLSSDVVQHLERTFRDDALTGVAFFFISFKIKATFDLTNIIQSLIAQLLTCRPDMPEELHPLQAHYRGGSALTLEQLKEALRAVFHGFARSYIIIDGLDECPNPEDAGAFEKSIEGRPREELLDLIKEIREWSVNSLRLFVASRPNDDIKDVLLPFVERAECTLIDLQEPRNQLHLKEDISRFLDQEFKNHLPTLAESADADLEIKNAAKKILLGKSDAMFLYAYLQMSVIKRRPVSKSSIERVLKNLPKDLDDTFDQMLLRIEKSNREQAVRVLTWIAIAPYRISVEEFSRASLVKFRSVEDIKAEEGSLERSMPLLEESGYLLERASADDIIALLPSLLVIEGPYNYLNLVHSSLLEYLLSQEIRAADKDPAIREFALNLTEAHLQVADAAFRLYVQGKETASATDHLNLRNDDYSSLAMVLRQAAGLAELIKLPNWPVSWHKLVAQAFFDKNNTPDLLPQHPLAHGLWSLDRMVPLEFAIKGEHFELLAFFFQNKLVSAQDEIPGHQYLEMDHTALSYASMNGSSAMMFNYLISQGCDIFCPVEEYPDLFEFISNRCSLASFRNLLEAPETLEKCQNRRYSPLLATLTRDFNEACTYFEGYLYLALIAKLVPHCFITFDRETIPALQTAIALRRTAFLESLIQLGADLNGKGQFFGNALQCAVVLMNTDAIWRLLQRGARTEPEGTEWDARILAIKEGSYFEDGQIAGKIAVERLKLAQSVFGEDGQSKGDSFYVKRFWFEMSSRGMTQRHLKIRWKYLQAYEGQPRPADGDYNESFHAPRRAHRSKLVESVMLDDRDYFTMFTEAMTI